MEKFIEIARKLEVWIICLFLVSIGYIVGYSAGCNRVLKTASEWEQMYDEHINRQWDMIHERDSIYMHYLQIRLHCDEYDNQFNR